MKIDKQSIKKYLIYAAALLAAGAVLYVLIWRKIKDISFANPKMLYLIIPVFALCILAGAFKYFFRPSVKYPLPSGGVPLHINIGARVINWIPFVLCAIALILCVLALARPREEGKTILPPTKGIDIMMTIDISQSMDAIDFTPNRITAAKATAEDFVNKRSSDRIGVVVFDDLALLQTPLTLDYFAVLDYIKMIQIGMIGGRGGTAIGDAITVAASP
jgi:Ca-activated chloride channel family protein